MALAAVLIAATIVACSGGGMPMATEPEPEPKPEPPGLTGSTWTRTDTDTDDGNLTTQVMVLTFTPERWVESTARYDASGARIDDGNRSGGWDSTDATIRKRWIEHDDDDDTVDGVEESVTKRYYWGDAEHSVLYVETWGADHPEEGLERFERVLNPLPSAAELFGTWKHHDPDGRIYTLMLSADGSFAYTRARTEARAGYTTTGTIVGVDLENYVVTLSGLVQTPEGKEPYPIWDGAGRIAFAPGTDGGIRVSAFWEELPIHQLMIENGYHNEYYPYGVYWLLFTKADRPGASSS